MSSPSTKKDEDANIEGSDEQILRSLRSWALKHSDDPKKAFEHRAAVGCQIMHTDGSVTKSANQLPPNLSTKISLSDSEDPNRYFWIEHAERAAIYKAVRNEKSLQGATMYLTRYPCSDCVRAIISIGIACLVVDSHLEADSRWENHHLAAEELLKASTVDVRRADQLK